MAKVKSVYEKTLNLSGDKTVTLTAEECMIICNALTILAPKEVDIIPLMTIMTKLTGAE